MNFAAIVALVLAQGGTYDLGGELQLPVERVAIESYESPTTVSEEENAVLKRIAAIARPQLHLSDFSSSRFLKEHQATLSLDVTRGEVRGFDTSLQLSFRL